MYRLEVLKDEGYAEGKVFTALMYDHTLFPKGLTWVLLVGISDPMNL